jgi:hypothetical protein
VCTHVREESLHYSLGGHTFQVLSPGGPAGPGGEGQRKSSWQVGSPEHMGKDFARPASAERRAWEALFSPPALQPTHLENHSHP